MVGPTRDRRQMRRGTALPRVATTALVVQQAGQAVTVINEQVFQGVDDPVPAGSGTGFIIDDQGHIVTNWQCG
ncbi:MAG: hypothetical protein R2839_07560 [Thermomicrobiales bacterium]